MKIKLLTLVTLVTPILLLTAGATSAAPADTKASDLVDVQAATCAQFEKAMSYAKPIEKASKKQAVFAELAQDDLVLAMTWVNGYLAGRDGTKSAHPFNQEWVVTYMGKLATVCKANSGSMLLTEAAAKL